jgi:O-antigen/teichoic acid export membrane protein
MVPTLQILCFFGATRAVNATWGSVYQAAGTPKTLTKLGFFQLLFMGMLVPPLTMHLGISGTAIAVAGSNLLCLVLAAREGLHILSARWHDFMTALIPGGVVATVVLMFAGGAALVIPDRWGALVALAMQGSVLAGAALIALMIWKAQVRRFFGVKHFI